MARSSQHSVNPGIEDYPSSPRSDKPHGGQRVQGVASAISVPRVSVITIVRNGFKTLPRARDSVLSQNIPSIEHIVVDGVSTDGTVELLHQYQDRIALWVSEPDLGISDAFNKGIALARGEIVGLLNSDDWYEPGAVRAVLTEMQKTGADIACGRLQYWDGDKRTFLVDSDPAQLERGMTVGHPTVFVRRECYRKHGLFRLDFRLAMDYEWMLRAKAAGARFVVVDHCLANMQGGGVGDRHWRKSQREVARARALHVRGADNAFAYHVYIMRRVFMGSVRRTLEAAGLGVVRRIYHRWFSPVKLTLNRDDN
jgi:glycosyltransferase involved in cell wall biosynthesis